MRGGHIWRAAHWSTCLEHADLPWPHGDGGSSLRFKLTGLLSSHGSMPRSRTVRALRRPKVERHARVSVKSDILARLLKKKLIHKSMEAPCVGLARRAQAPARWPQVGAAIVRPTAPTPPFTTTRRQRSTVVASASSGGSKIKQWRLAYAASGGSKTKQQTTNDFTGSYNTPAFSLRTPTHRFLSAP